MRVLVMQKLDFSRKFSIFVALARFKDQ